MAQAAERLPSKPRTSVFREIGLFEDEETIRKLRELPSRPRRPSPTVRFRSNASIIPTVETADSEWEDTDHSDIEPDFELKEQEARAILRRQAWSPAKMWRIGFWVALMAVALPMVQTSSIFGTPGRPPLGAKGRVIRTPVDTARPVERSIVKREDTNTDVCKRWSQQSALVNGTLYMYGGHATTDAQQTSNTWTNDFLTLDLTQTWQISSPSLTGLPIPSGPPSVSNGYLWNSHSSLYLYGGEFSDTPAASPVAFSMWEYDIGASQWNEHSNPQTSAGNNSAGDGESVQRSAEGAGFGVASLGRGWYFGGHLDGYTTEGWSQSIERVYLKSMLEFTFPGFSNDGVSSLSGGQTAGSDGVWRNVTTGGDQDSNGFPERADGILVYVPGFGADGILLGLTGGTNATFTQMNIIDVYDIATSTWYKQTTSGTTPKARVNPCAVVAAAADGSSYNVYMFGGQNLQPYEEQIQYDDMWILTVPSFTWIEVTTDSQVPPARAGHTCNIWDGQMVVVGGYVPQNVSCDSPGVYVFNMSSLSWENQFTALSGTGSSNPFSQQIAQIAGKDKDKADGTHGGLEGSYGYEVPEAVISVIGGSPTGGATVTVPVQSPSGGPLATGKPITYTVTGSGGVVTATAAAGSGSSSDSAGSRRSNIVAIVVGVIAGVFAIIAAYFAFCTWVYRKQLKLYKNHDFMAQRAAANAHAARAEKEGMLGAAAIGSAKTSHERNDSYAGSGAAASGAGRGGSSGEAPGSARRSSDASSNEDLLAGQEPSFWGARGVLLNPRRSLRVINRD